MRDNQLIAEFMGAKQVNMHTAIEGRRYSILTKNYPQTLKYHTSWEWLMPVVDKIELDTIHPMFNFSMHLGKMYADITCILRPTGVDPPPDIIYNNMHCDSKIECAYKCVVDFIKWHNQQKVEKD